jgi:hypothetical protein
LGNSAGAWVDNKDKDRQVALIISVLNENRDNEINTTQYQKSFRNPNTGQQQTGVVSQSAVPLRTYPPQGNMYARNDIPKHPRGMATIYIVRIRKNHSGFMLVLFAIVLFLLIPTLLPNASNT